MTLIVTRGLPGAGKSTAAERWLDADTYEHRVLLSRDSLRRTMFGHREGVLDQEAEVLITKTLLDLVKAHLVAGHHVCVDAQHLRDRDVRAWRDLAFELGHVFEVIDKRDVPLERCLFGNASRLNPVPEAYIRKQHERFIKGRDLSAPLASPVSSPPEELPVSRRYYPDTSLPMAVILDVDGTVALHDGVRSPYDTSKYHLDAGNEPIIRIAQALAAQGYTIVVTSGRSAEFYQVTLAWLSENHVPVHDLIMRKRGDKRRDDIVKLELFWDVIAPAYNVVAAIDDRDRVVKAWRSIGLTCLQVAEGNF